MALLSQALSVAFGHRPDYASRSAGHIDKEDVVNLYRAVAVMAGHKRGLPRYLALSLSLEPTDDHAALVASIHQHIRSAEP